MTEMMVVVAIIAVVVASAIYTITRSRQRVSVERATSDLRGRIARVQSLAAVAGSRLGTARMAYAPSCTPDPANQMVVRFRGGGVVELPATVTYNAGADQLTVACELYDIGAETRGTGAIAAPAVVTEFAFTAAGRLLVQNPAGAADVFVEVSQANDVQRYGFRILPSGIICRDAAGGGPCNEDVGT